MKILLKILSLPYVIKLKGEILALKLVNDSLKDDLKNKLYKEYIKIKNESDIAAKNKQIETLKQQVDTLKQQLKERKKGDK